MTMDGTIQDWRADLVDDGYGYLDVSPRAKAMNAVARCAFTRLGIADAVHAWVHVDGVRVLSPRLGLAVVLLRMDHEYSPGGTDRAQRVEDARQALELIRPAGIELVVMEDDPADELRACCACRAPVIDSGDIPNPGRCATCTED